MARAKLRYRRFLLMLYVIVVNDIAHKVTFEVTIFSALLHRLNRAILQRDARHFG